MLFKIFGVVVVGKFFIGSDFALCKYIDPLFTQIDFAIGEAGVVNITSSVSRDIAVDHCFTAGPKKIFASIFILLFFAHRVPAVFDNACAARDLSFSKYPKASTRAPYS